MSSIENSSTRWIIPYYDYYKIDKLSKEEKSNLDKSYLQLCLCLGTIASWVEGGSEGSQNQEEPKDKVLSDLTDITLLKLPYKPKSENLHVALKGSDVSCMNAEHKVIAAVAPILIGLNQSRQSEHSPSKRALFHGSYTALPNSWIGEIPRYSVWDALTTEGLKNISCQLGRAGLLSWPRTVNCRAVDMHININLDSIKAMTSLSGVDHASFDGFFRSICAFQSIIMHYARSGTSTTTFHLANTISAEDEAVLRTILNEINDGRKHKFFLTHEPARDPGYIQA